MIDFHCHLDLYENLPSVLQGIIKHKCHVLAVTTTPLAWEGTSNLIGDTARVKIAVGLHPELVMNRHSEVYKLCELINETHYVGEVGIDASKRFRASLSAQREVFDTILSACESAGGRIISIHSRGAVSLVLDHLETHRKVGVPIMHWFSGTPRELERAVELGCWFSISPAMLRSNKGRRIASLMPSDRVLTETDGPFTRRGSASYMPWDVKEAENILAGIWSISRKEVSKRLAVNLRHVIEMTC